MKKVIAVVGALSVWNALAFEPIFLKATDFIEVGGKPSLVTWSRGAAHVPVWSLSGGTVGQSVAALTAPLPAECAGVKVELIVATQDKTTNPSFTDVFRVHLSQVAAGEKLGWRGATGKPVLNPLPAEPDQVRSLVIESYHRVQPGCPLAVRVQREPGDPGDTFTRPAGLVAVRVTPLAAPEPVRTVESKPGYNAWPMMQAIGQKLVCAYSRGSGHSIGEGKRGVYARTSTDGGKTWTPEVLVADDPAYGEVTIGKGLDQDGAMLLWIRCVGGPKGHHDLYRTTDGVTFEKIASPAFDPFPMQVTDVFKTKSGLMSLWFATHYGKDSTNNAWGTLTSADNGKTWVQHTVEGGLTLKELPVEQSAVSLGDGRILAIARTEGGPTALDSQFQLTSTDDGVTWKRERTSIRDVSSSTPSLLYDAKTDLVTNYYYERGKGVLKRRIVKASAIFDRPLAWPAAEGVGFGEEDRPWDAGNVNATEIGRTHYAAYYHGTRTDSSVCIVPVPAP